MTDFDDDAPLTLRDAARRAFPAGGMTPAKLRRAIDSGKLKGYRVGRTVFTKLKDVRVMLDSSVIKPTLRVDRNARGEPPDPFGRTPAQVAHERASAALDKVLADLRKSKKRIRS